MKQRLWTGIAAAFGMLLMILDTKTALIGAQDGLRLCIMTVVPSLLPFIFLSNLLTSALTGTNSKIVNRLGDIMHMPHGSASLFLVGALGGYPTGAQIVATAYTNKQLFKADAQRLLGFCSNAGPSFIFGITAMYFTEAHIPWILWCIHLVSAFLTGIVLPGGSSHVRTIKRSAPLSFSDSLKRSVSVMAQICGWIILFRVILAFISRWFLWLCTTELQVFIKGIAELTIGCTSLSGIQNYGLRFVICAAILGFGGICVLMQTASVTAELGLGMYLPGKILQCVISVILAFVYQNYAFPIESRIHVSPNFYGITIITVIICLLSIQIYKKRCSIPVTVVV